MLATETAERAVDGCRTFVGVVLLALVVVEVANHLYDAAGITELVTRRVKKRNDAIRDGLEPIEQASELCVDLEARLIAFDLPRVRRWTRRVHTSRAQDQHLVRFQPQGIGDDLRRHTVAPDGEVHVLMNPHSTMMTPRQSAGRAVRARYLRRSWPVAS